MTLVPEADVRVVGSVDLSIDDTLDVVDAVQDSNVGMTQWIDAKNYYSSGTCIVRNCSCLTQ